MRKIKIKIDFRKQKRKANKSSAPPTLIFWLITPFYITVSVVTGAPGATTPKIYSTSSPPPPSSRKRNLNVTKDAAAATSTTTSNVVNNNSNSTSNNGKCFWLFLVIVLDYVLLFSMIEIRIIYLPLMFSSFTSTNTNKCFWVLNVSHKERLEKREMDFTFVFRKVTFNSTFYFPSEFVTCVDFSESFIKLKIHVLICLLKPFYFTFPFLPGRMDINSFNVLLLSLLYGWSYFP